MFVDTGATYTCVGPSYASHLPMSDKFVKTVGFSGKLQTIPMTAPVQLTMEGETTTLPVLVSEQTPVNLLGRDALCKLNVNISCTPEGVKVDRVKEKFQMNVQTARAKVYWLGDISEPVLQAFQKWEKYICAQIPKASKPRSEYHCTVYFDPSCSKIFEEKWETQTEGLTVSLTTEYIIIGQEGAAFNVESNPFLAQWYNVPNSAPHITLLVNENFASKDLGPMMKNASKITWNATENPLIFVSPDETKIKILCGTHMVSKPKEVIITSFDVPQMPQIREGESDLKQEMLEHVPENLWSKHETDVGLVKSANPVRVELKPNMKLPRRAQYPLKLEAEKGISQTIEGLLKAGVLIETHSFCNTPILPVKKAVKSKYRLVHDLRAVNEIVQDSPVEVPNPHTLLTNVPPEAKFFTVIDLCSAYFSVPLHEDSQHLFAFTYRGKQYCYTRMPQGFKHSPHVFNQVLREDLEGLQLNSTLLQYVDDLLICAPTLEDCHRDSIKLLQKLAEGGHKTSQAKLQYCQPQVEYLGRVISHGTISVAPSQLEGVSKVPLPLTVGQMMTFLGMTGFSSNWIVDYAVKTAPLRGIMKEGETQTLRSPLKWTNESRIAFETIKQEMQTAPALATPDYGKPFFLYVSNRHNMYASAVLMQETCSGRRKQPLAYYSTKLDNVVQGWPPCYQGLAAVHYAYEKASTITMGHPVTIYTHHKISELIHQNRFVITQARCLQYLPLLTYPDVTIKRCATVNPADTMPFSFEGEPHECVPEAMKYTKLRPDLESTPLLNAEVTYFVDGSCYRDHLGSHAGFAVIKQEGSDFVTIKAESCIQPCSAQLAELKALTEACRMAKGKTANVYTDSAYAHGVCHLFGAVWKQRGYKKSDGSPIHHQKQIVDLISAMMQPTRLAVIKCQAHRKGNEDVVQGNNAADEAAKLASKSQVTVLAPLVSIEPVATPDDIVLMQQNAGLSEHSLWQQRGASKDEKGLWRSHEGLLVAPVSLLTVLISDVHSPDHCAKGEVVRKIKQQGYWSPYLQSMIDEVLGQCEVCAQNNVRKGITTPIGHIPVPEGPFKHLVLDYVDMIKSVHGKRYMLVVIDRFSRWVEAMPSKDQSSETVVKFLLREVIPRFGIPSEISSDNGPAFVQKVAKGILQQLRIRQRLGCVYHPQSQGMVERVNGTKPDTMGGINGYGTQPGK
ncbi:uncharacterized protein LOC129190003 isoform X1 [Dunckerocampus dactyliophorus]|uniref:uncharacterized protein LOC129190003 isoform X1 n=1 Tax=Dunckerocampus dactyliophorus TaxID=161453 RepID=UPI0024057E34|nr:uncharacterized protein LOC129190003 isoform X1 [Dunckerocampus dactyliophorus]